MLGKFGECTSHCLLEHLAYLAADGCLALGAKHFCQLLQRFHEAERRLIDDHCMILFRQQLQACLPTFLLRQEPLEIEPFARQARIHQCRHERRSTRQALHLYAFAYAGTYEHEARVADAWCTGIADQGYLHAGRDTTSHLVARLMFVELMMTLQRRMDIVVLQQHGRRAGVFGQNQIGFTEHPQRPLRDILQVAYRCGNDVQHYPRRR